MKRQALSSWQDSNAAPDWVARDALAAFPDLSRRFSPALVAQLSKTVSLVPHVRVGPGAQLEAFLKESVDARGVWASGSEVMREQAVEHLDRFGDRAEFHQVDITEMSTGGLHAGADAVNPRFLWPATAAGAPAHPATAGTSQPTGRAQARGAVPRQHGVEVVPTALLMGRKV